MKQRYDDIIEAVGQEPIWWTMDGVPRFKPFSPYDVSDIYANEAALVEIACQCCGKKYQVAMTSSNETAMTEHHRMVAMTFHLNSKNNGTTNCSQIEAQFPREQYRLHTRIKTGNLFYKDPPNTGCCASGASMTSLMIKVLEYWTKDHQRYIEAGRVLKPEENYSFVRYNDMEVDLPDKKYYDLDFKENTE